MNARPLDEDFINLLPTRRKGHLKTLHCVVANDKFYCLDLSLKASSKRELDAMILATLERIDYNAILPCAPREDWMQLPGKMELVRRYDLPIMVRPPTRLGVFLLTGPFQESW